MKLKLLCWVFFLVLRSLHATYRYRVFGAEKRRRAEGMHPEGAFAFACWHGNSLSGTLAHTYQKFCPLCSQSKDGQLVAFLCEKMGLRPVRGSSSKGGKSAREELTSFLKQGYSTAITVDGPRGPRHVTKSGIVSVAKDGRCAILPLCAVPDRYWQLTSWDRLKVPKPFARIAVIYGEPISVPQHAAGEVFDKLRDTVTTALMELEDQVEGHLANWKAGDRRYLAQNRLEHSAAR